MKRLELIRQIERNGCVLLRHGGKHDWYQNPGTGACQPIPRNLERRMLVSAANRIDGRLHEYLDRCGSSREAGFTTSYKTGLSHGFVSALSGLTSEPIELDKALAVSLKQETTLSPVPALETKDEPRDPKTQRDPNRIES